MFASRIKWINVLLLIVLMAGIIGYCQNKISNDNEKKKIKMDSTYGDVEIATLVNDGKTYNYAVNYPVFKNKVIDEKFKSYAEKELHKFQQEYKKANQESTKTRYELNINYNIVHYAKQSVAVVFDEYKYLGGANGETTQTTFNFDFDKQKFIKLNDIFKKDTDYLNQLSYISYQELKKEKEIAANDELLKEGTAPTQKNFSHFAVKEDYLEIYFDKYQVAAGYLGEQSIAIKKDLLKDMMKEKYLNKEKNKNKIKENKPKHEVISLPKEETIDPAQKAIALTFDDGPNPATTNQILDSLKKYNGHATFFVLGNRVQYYPETLKRTLKEGHEVGNHSWSHPLLTRLSVQEAMKQINDTQNIIEKISGYRPTHVRPPYGGLNDSLRTAFNMKVALWDVDPEDWKYRDKKTVVNHVLSQAGDGKTILIHDIYSTSADAADEIIRKLTDEGYQLVTVTQMEEIKKQREEK
ncbi:polysaccharide deacetylase family protein [Bacillus atrophaeus]|uniref:polysaccharide deacetylase family protein n=1 Tax=Bacillus atrophaeus TaxID=1452 RepID=UPI00227F6077|nr:polysaccharide deacetylase family protein [Bacillus atrophaeus]MCY8489694.1 polysaccharide deacetylase family protein [Bacillus atrophaeus]MCY8816847.1 polysaccharide deacetylase family protein [Bacillus atrophaeus]